MERRLDEWHQLLRSICTSPAVRRKPSLQEVLRLADEPLAVEERLGLREQRQLDAIAGRGFWATN